MALSRSQIVEQERRKILLLKDEFIDDVANFRKNHHIPAGGFKKSEGSKNYYYLLYELSDKYNDKQDKTRMVEAFKLQDAGRHREARDLFETIRNENPLNAMIADSKKLSEKYAITGLMADRGLESFLISGDENTFTNEVSSTTHTIHQAENLRGIKRIDIHVYKHTREEDVLEYYREAKKWRSMMIGNNKETAVPSTYIDRDIEIFKLRKAKMPSKEVGVKYGLSYGEVDSIYRNMKAKISKV